MPAPIKVTNNQQSSRFESEAEGHTAVLAYEIGGNRITLTHTRVPEAIAGRGIGTALVEAALSFAREHHFQVEPQCPFAAKYFAGHPEYQSLLAK
ncbi:hypothetical protein HNQ77_004197 [Silvibacterium bohemicum]|uniref:N-acetyltransferase domain-containing protein n=1 Tax=Silvibacterium bohemicum TaxID=1577686 RepID=A0A841JZX8_9BACT|nr:GNAT family N-acetyltransferase [Silvibacterium bohemicum]MBB6146225.1 hypothetical protein [Silvibacterium bohemicum]